ncbi:MAG TPA: uroporphyrinogen decarboxylase family protein [Dehalococcoidales bacterium]|nr:uroporphyrinogen decarboxylase family protein [Dehalococcoidales bacterium]
MSENWNTMTASERQEAMFQKWLSPPGVKFVDAAAEKAYKERVTRIKDAIQLKKQPDRTPVFLIVGFFPAAYSGMTTRQAMYDYDKLYAAWKKYCLDFSPDAHLGIAIPTPGRVFDILDYKLYSWPGHGVAENLGYQYNEGEYMMPDEYDAFIEDPHYFFHTVYLPRICGELAPLRAQSNFANIQEMLFLSPNILTFGLPDVQAAYKKLFAAGEEALKWIGYVGKFDAEMTTLGYPDFFGGFSKAPFDTLGDTLRGTRGIMVDMYRRPEKLIAAMERIVPMMIRMGVSTAKAAGNPIVFLPLHKGADGFMNEAQFKKFYWPTLKKVFMGLINEGCVPFPWAEGGYNSRLEIIRDMPKGTMLWGFDATDMARAKQVLGDVSCIGGNVPMSILQIGAPKEVTKYCKDLNKVAGKGGGFILMNGAAIDDVKAENMHAMIKSVL